MSNKQLMLAVTAVGILGLTSIFGVQSALADETNSPMSSLVEKIANRFNLNQDEVQAVFDEHRDEMHAQMEARFEEHLQQAVDDGKITTEQKDKIIAKLKELESQRQANRESMQSMTEDERHEAMEQQREELEQWAEDNNIPLQYLHGGFGVRMHHGGPGMGFGETSTSTH